MNSMADTHLYSHPLPERLLNIEAVYSTEIEFIPPAFD